MRITTRAVLLLACLAYGPSMRGQAPADEAAVLATVQRLFDAMATHDTAAARAVLLPGTRFVSMNGDSASGPVRLQADSAFVRMLGSRPERFLERIWAPVVRIQGPIAMVWTPYDFHLGGQWSHCGIDTFTLVRGAGGWQIASLLYTVQRQGCSPSPLGPPARG